MSKYSVDFTKLTKLLLPVCLRGNTLMAFLRSMVAPIEYVASEFDTFREDKDFRIKHNGQVCYLRAMLKEKVLGGLVVVDNTAKTNALVLYKRSETTWTTIETDTETSIYRRGFAGGNDAGFIVRHVGRPIHQYVAQITALVNEYKLAGMKFTVDPS